ncbi:MAG: lipase family protein [Cyclobacteriaceae bacterium]|nr:lipase family protein [Cyclobacteriaceae bacterium]
MIKFRHISLWFFTMICLVLVSCDRDEVTADLFSVEPRLSSSQFVFTRTAGDIRGLFTVSGLDLPVQKINYATQMWRVEYNTLYKGTTITASGLVYIPESEESLPLISIQHGTIADNASAPSQKPLQDVENLLYAGLAATGFVVAVPDYIGFGSSRELMHPYYVAEATDVAVADMIRAAAELANENGRKLSKNLYLAGYSQGGYATLATQKYVEEQGMEYFNLKASFPAAGGYDLIGMRDYLVGLEVYHEPFYLAYVAASYQDYYGLDSGLYPALFRQPYAQVIPDVFDGLRDGGDINALLHDSLAVFLTQEFIQHPDTTAFHEFNTLLTENSLLGWIPEVPVFFYHGTADVTVPFQNSQATYDHFMAVGASAGTVSLTPLTGYTHYTGFVPYITGFLDHLLAMEGI